MDKKKVKNSTKNIMPTKYSVAAQCVEGNMKEECIKERN